MRVTVVLAHCSGSWTQQYLSSITFLAISSILHLYPSGAVLNHQQFLHSTVVTVRRLQLNLWELGGVPCAKLVAPGGAWLQAHVPQAGWLDCGMKPPYSRLVKDDDMSTEDKWNVGTCIEAPSCASAITHEYWHTNESNIYTIINEKCIYCIHT